MGCFYFFIAFSKSVSQAVTHIARILRDKKGGSIFKNLNIVAL